jgi:hypothetical protein
MRRGSEERKSVKICMMAALKLFFSIIIKTVPNLQPED